MNSPDRRTRRAAPRIWVTVALVVVVIAVAAAAYALGRDHHTGSMTDQQMAARAQQVMPFDLNRTTHTFTKKASGGVQVVVVKDPADTRDLALIRAHLRDEAEQFRAGNYSDPAKIHGMDMPGVKELEQGASRIHVEYGDAPNGGQVTYSTSEPALIDALHAWFDRQRSDHSMPGMGGWPAAAARPPNADAGASCCRVGTISASGASAVVFPQLSPIGRDSGRHSPRFPPLGMAQMDTLRHEGGREVRPRNRR